MKKYLIYLVLALAGASFAHADCRDCDCCRDEDSGIISKAEAVRLLDAIDLLAPKKDVNANYITITSATYYSAGGTREEKTEEEQKREQAERELDRAKERENARKIIEKLRAKLRVKK